jgi:hypothetical protein
MFEKEVRELIWVYIILSLGGLLLHLRLHSPAESLFNWLGTGFPLVNIFITPFLLNRASTVAWGFLFVCVTVVAGATAMAYDSITSWNVPVTFKNAILHSTFPDILILSIKIPLVHKVLRYFRPKGEPERRSEGCSE